MRLRELCAGIRLHASGAQPDDRPIDGVTADSRQLKKNGLFVAIQGTERDGHDFISEAVRAGASAVVASAAIIHTKRIKIPPHISVLLVDDTRTVIGLLASRWYGDPSQNLHVIGVTGTNGKTTTTHLISTLLEPKGSCAVLGTVEYRIGDFVKPAEMTTPDPCKLQEYFHDMLIRKASYCAMEVSSHALVQERVKGVYFRSAVFTNLTQDHLDYHGDMESYFLAKEKLFSNFPLSKPAVINIDDAYGRRLIERIKRPVTTYGFRDHAVVCAEKVEHNLEGSALQLKTPYFTAAVFLPLLGEHNVYNFLAAASIALSEGISRDELLNQIPKLKSPRGRLERIDCGQPFSVFVDYAHSPDAVERILIFLRSVTSGRLIVVIGCGGDRDRTKRAKMGKIAAERSDIAVVTSDNPRSEDPLVIIQEIKSGFKSRTEGKCIDVIDRKEAIRHALSLARPHDVVAILGKGHEEVQIIGDRRIPFSDQATVREILKERSFVLNR